MNINNIQNLLDKIRSLPKAATPEATIFSIGGRGHYENPITDILAFFCHSEGEHGLDNLVVNALFDALHVEVTTHDTAVINEPQREVVTAKNKRLDLLLEGNDWVMVIENKIWHQ